MLTLGRLSFVPEGNGFPLTPVILARIPGSRTAAALARTSMARWGRPKVIVGPVRFLASPEAAFVWTGWAAVAVSCRPACASARRHEDRGPRDDGPGGRHGRGGYDARRAGFAGGGRVRPDAAGVRRSPHRGGLRRHQGVAALRAPGRTDVYARAPSTCGASPDSYVRDAAEIEASGPPCFETGPYAQDQGPCGKVIDRRCAVEIDGVRIEPGAPIFGDRDGVLVIPREAEAEAVARAVEKPKTEDEGEKTCSGGMSATGALGIHGIMQGERRKGSGRRAACPISFPCLRRRGGSWPCPMPCPRATGPGTLRPKTCSFTRTASTHRGAGLG